LSVCLSRSQIFLSGRKRGKISKKSENFSSEIWEILKRTRRKRDHLKENVSKLTEKNGAVWGEKVRK
jgi:hypothetical protein